MKQTHAKIKAAFSELLAEKSTLADVTVADVLKRTKITRSTFYAHFNSIAAVAAEIESELVLDFAPIVENETDSDSAKAPKPLSAYFHELINFLSVHENFYRKLFQSPDSLTFLAKLNSRIRQTLKTYITDHHIERPMLELDVAFFSDGASYLLLKYFRDEVSMNLDEIEWYLKQHFPL